MLIHRRCSAVARTFDSRYLRRQDYEVRLRLLRRFKGAPVQGPTFVWRVHDGPLLEFVELASVTILLKRI